MNTTARSTKLPFATLPAGARSGDQSSQGLIEKALAHVASIHPSVTQVVYDDELRWCYTDADGVYVVFNKREDISLLEEAADEAYTRGLQNKVITL